MILYVTVTLQRHKTSLPRRFLILKCCKKYLRASVLSTNLRKQSPELLSNIQTYHVWWKTIKHHNSLLTWPNFHPSPQLISPSVFLITGNINKYSTSFWRQKPRDFHVSIHMTSIITYVCTNDSQIYILSQNHFSELQNFISNCHFVISS